MKNVSVVVPVYNSEKKLARCIEALLNQTIDDIELIFINDASKDSSLEILLEYESRFPDKIMVVNLEKNSGAGGARNAGLMYASAEWIGFVDSDDVVMENMYEQLYRKAIAGDYDVVESMFYTTKDKKINRGIEEMFCERVLDSEKRGMMLLSAGVICSKLFKRSIIEENNITFREKVKLEDSDFLLKYLLHCNKIGRLNETMYIYDNATTEETWCVKEINKKEYTSTFELLKAYAKIYEEEPAARECGLAIEGLMLHIYNYAVHCCVSENGANGDDIGKLRAARKEKNKVRIAGLENKYFLDSADEDSLEIIKYVETI